MAEFSDYLAEGVSAVASARDQTSSKWASEWRQGAVDYALASQANQHEIDMWNLQNAYNSPTAQMQRYAEAGLNPNLVYQQGNPGNASSAPGTHQAQAPNFAQHKQARIAEAMAAINSMTAISEAVSGMIGKAQDIQLRSNELKLSNMRTSVLERLFDEYGSSKGDPEYRQRVLEGELFKSGTQNAIKSFMAPYQAGYLDSRRYYQNYYNQNVLPLYEELMSGRVDALKFSNQLLEYQNQMYEAMPPEERMLWFRLNQAVGLGRGISSMF